MIADDVAPNGALLGCSPLIPRASREDMIRGLEEIYRVRSADLAGSDTRYVGRANRVGVREGLQHVTLHYCHYEAAADIRFPDLPGYRQVIPLRGRGLIEAPGSTMHLDRATTGLLAPERAFRARYEAGYAHLVLQIDDAALARKAPAVLGIDGDRFRAATGVSAPTRQFWRLRAQALTLASYFSAECQPSDIAIREMEAALVTSFLLDHHAPDANDEPATGRHLMKHLDDVITANLHQALPIEVLALECGVSVRTVHNHINAHRNLTPSEYIRELRLTRCRQALETPDPDTSVAGVAAAYGFGNIGHFARRYMERFGELPSKSLLRGRKTHLG